MRHNHEESIMKENRGSILIQLLILVVVGFGVYYIIQTVHDAAQQAVAPWEQANNAMQTQVSDLMHPTPTVIPDPITYINQIQALARLETIRYTRGTSCRQLKPIRERLAFLFGDKIFCQVHGTRDCGNRYVSASAGRYEPADRSPLCQTAHRLKSLQFHWMKARHKSIMCRTAFSLHLIQTWCSDCLQGAKDKITAGRTG